MTSQQSEGHTFNPYLLRGVVVNWMPQVWSVDMPYSGLQAGAVHAGAMIDWVDRYVLTWAVSITAERAPSGAGLPDPQRQCTEDEKTIRRPGKGQKIHDAAPNLHIFHPYSSLDNEIHLTLSGARSLERLLRE
jgi:hypothetical protein